jgi:hypothetical protein
MRVAPNWITELEPSQVFVFGSNTEGGHWGGAAKIAVQKFGAIMFRPTGIQGQSYAIVTKDLRKGNRSVGLDYIKEQVETFKEFAKVHCHLEFLCTRIGCDLAGFTDAEIAPMFRGIPDNVLLPKEWLTYLK